MGIHRVGIARVGIHRGGNCPGGNCPRTFNFIFFLYNKRVEILSNVVNSNSYFGCFFANSLRQYAFKLVVVIV